jgi:putative ABC transport system substrate-binding protein
VERLVQSEDQARSVMSALRKGDVDGVISLRSLSLNIPGLLLETATRAPMPAMFHIPFFVERGGLASYSASERELGGQAARLVDKILRGARPGELPVEQPTKFELVVNVKTARALGLALPPSLLLRADRLISTERLGVVVDDVAGDRVA